MFSFFMLVSGLTAGADEQDAENYLYSSALLCCGMLLMVGATWFSQRAAIAIGLVAAGCAVWAVDPFWGFGALLMLLLAGVLETRPSAPRWQHSPSLAPASVVAFAGALACWFLAGQTYNPLYLVGAVAALAIPRWPPGSWAGAAVTAFVVWRGYTDVRNDPPELGVRDPLIWFVAPATVMLTSYLVVPWLVMEVRAWSRARREASSPSTGRLVLPLMCTLGLVVATATAGRESWQDRMDDLAGPATEQAPGIRPTPPLARVTPIPVMPDTNATGINDTGQAVGTSVEVGHGYQAVAWPLGTTVALDPMAPGEWGFAEAINDAGQVVGWSQDMATLDSAAILWQNGQVIALDAPSDHDYRMAWDINEGGQIAGASGNSVSNHQAALWQDGELIQLLILPGHSRSDAHAINDAGQIVGVSSGGNDDRVHAVLWQDGEMIDLGAMTGTRSSGASDINNAGQVVGWTRNDATGSGDAVLWEAGRMTVLRPLPDSHSAEAEAISEAGQVVGHTYDRQGRSHAVLWDDGAVIDLGLLPGDRSAEAADINESGHIVGVSRAANSGRTTAVIWDRGQMMPLPWPGTTTPATPAASPVTMVRDNVALEAMAPPVPARPGIRRRHHPSREA